MNKETLGNSQAFASIAVDKQGTYGSTGLAKREYFAAMAMQGILSQHDSRPSYAATLAVAYADALIEALNK
jgi:hypothetical protein